MACIHSLVKSGAALIVFCRKVRPFFYQGMHCLHCTNLCSNVKCFGHVVFQGLVLLPAVEEPCSGLSMIALCCKHQCTFIRCRLRFEVRGGLTKKFQSGSAATTCCDQWTG